MLYTPLITRRHNRSHRQLHVLVVVVHLIFISTVSHTQIYTTTSMVVLLLTMKYSFMMTMPSIIMTVLEVLS